jgi:hypothetical protein
MRASLVVLWMVAAGSGACSSVVGSDAGDTGVAMDAGDASALPDVGRADSTTPDAPAPDAGATPCPADSSATGACTVDGLQCTYGDDPRASCRTRLSCAGGMWQLTSPRCTPLGTACGSAPMQMVVCATDGDVCVYTDGTRCNCAYCPSGGPACANVPPTRWFCLAPPANASCPRTMPNLGERCSATDGTQCDYDGCGSGMAVTCMGGFWVPALIGCPA